MSEIFNEVIFKGSPEDVIWKSDVHKLSNDAKIFARKDCDVVFLRKGAFMGAFDDREEFYLVDTKKQGFLNKLFNGKAVSDDCDVYYINRVAQLENMWGTPNRIDIYDKDYDLHTSVGSNGSYKFSINNSMKLFSKVMGSNESLTQDMVRSFFRNRLNMEIRNALATVFNKNRFGLKDIASITTREKEIAEEIHVILKPIFSDYGVELNEFIILQFSYDEEFLSQIREIRKDSILRKMKFDSEKDERKEAREDFKVVTDGVAKVQSNAPKQEVHIHNDVAEGTKFCIECGTKLPKSAKFCSNCGYKF